MAPVFVVCTFLFASCAKEEVMTFDDQISVAQDFKVDAATNDTFYRVYMPTAFTPNDDGRNDVYIIYGTGWETEGFEMRVFSREGNLVYNTDDAYRSFDGRTQSHSDLNAQQVYTVDVLITDTTGEQHHYNYKIAALF